ncbi:MAG: dienelactone hydrolase family protein, partial [Polyangiaceae bacterium]|nr:dienelactone hydrolase family protein [Polyangiaceae bacterium]
IVHGLGDRPRIAREPEPEEMPLRVLMPEAPTPFDRGRAWFPIRVRDGRGADMAKALRQTTHELADFLDAAVARYGSPCRPIVAGFSQGGIVAWALAVRHPDSVTAAFPMASWLPPEIATEARQRAPSLPPVRMLHGDRDRIVPLRGTHSIVEVLAAGGASIELEVEEGAGHELTAGMKLRLARLFGESIARCVDAASM